MKNDIPEKSVQHKCPKCGNGNFVQKTNTAKGWKKILSLLFSISSISQPNRHKHKLVCTKCGSENIW